MTLKQFLDFYRQGWWLVLKAIIYLIAFWAILLPYKLIEVLPATLPPAIPVVLNATFLLLYLPIAVHIAHRIIKDINKTDHQFTPLLERWKRHRSAKRPS